MFETSVIHAQARGSIHGERRVGLLAISLTLHAVAIVGVVGASIRSISFPERAPNQFALPVMARPVSIPPALGTPNGGHRATPPLTVRHDTAPNTAPNTIPTQVVPVTPANTTTSDANLSIAGPGSDNNPQGVPWGSREGIGTDGPPSNVTPAIDETPLPVGGEVKAPVAIRRVQPLYPRVALQARMNGWVIVECIIDRNGHVRDAKILKSSFTAFEQPAVDAVQQWTFTPGSLRGHAVDTIFDLTVTFRITS